MASDLAAGVLAGDRTAIGRAITLVESTLPAHRAEAAALLDVLLPHAGNAQRVGITGVPGVGKSTFIESLGLKLTASGHKVSVMAVDPSNEASQAFVEMAEWVLAHAPSKRTHPELKIT